jgi:hypothetical protein
MASWNRKQFNLEKEATVIALPTADGQVVSGSCVLYGATLCDSSGVAQRAHLHNGTSTAGPHIMGLFCGANQSQNQQMSVGIACPNGIYIDVLAGTLVGSLFYKMAQ